jgi:penicillin-binding protein 1A
MTGGTLPAATWHNIMSYAHQGVELRALPGLPPPSHAPALADTSFKGVEQPVLLTRKGTEALIQAERMLDDALHTLTVQSAPTGSLGVLDGGASDKGGADTLATAANRDPPADARRD